MTVQTMHVLDDLFNAPAFNEALIKSCKAAGFMAGIGISHLTSEMTGVCPINIEEPYFTDSLFWTLKHMK